MKNTHLIASLFFLFSGATLFSQLDSTATLIIEFTGLTSNEGQIAVGLNNSPEGWPRKADLEFAAKKELQDGGIMMVTISDLPYGTYAISAMDDLNCNLKMDMFLGIPKEDWGFSMNPPLRISVPEFEKCSFELNKPFTYITIEIRNLRKNK